MDQTLTGVSDPQTGSLKARTAPDSQGEPTHGHPGQREKILKGWVGNSLFLAIFAKLLEILIITHLQPLS